MRGHREPAAGGGEVKRRPAALLSRRNWRDTRAYLAHCADVLHAAEGSVRLYRTALDHLLRWATEIPFSKAPDIRPVFPRYLADQGELSGNYQSKLLEICRAFFAWARGCYPDNYPGAAYVETLRPVTDQQGTVQERELYTLDDLLRLAAVPVQNLTEQRNRAAACFLFLSGMRATAFVTLPLLAVDVSSYEVRQWPSLGVQTKNRKAATTYLLQSPQVAPLLEVVREWDTLVRRSLEPSAPWYALLESTGESFAAEQTPGRSRTQNLARHLERLCQQAGIEYRSPHKFRHGFAVYGLSLCKTMEDFKAVSQNLMHAQMGTTDAVYSALLNNQVATRIAALGKTAAPTDEEQRIQALVQSLFRQELERLAN